jgi:hypothetical protein
MTRIKSGDAVSRTVKSTQGRRLIALLKRRMYSCMELQQTGISTCWWKRVDECLADHEFLCKISGKDGLLRYRVSAATKWTA